ncbi:MAG: hypothetical protein HDT26_05035 [Subdoligranulum sp.]|nr:hypothetical protein [Subdoligranulum sp.]
MQKEPLGTDRVRVIKIGKEALFEFLYEQFIEHQEQFFDIDALEAADFFEVDWENGQFLFGVQRSEDADGNFLPCPCADLDLKKLMRNLPDTASSLYACSSRYQEYSKSELLALSEKPEEP